MIVGAQAPGSTQYDYPMLGNALFGTEVQGHHRLRGDAEINLAMERGEVHGTWANWSTLKAINSNGSRRRRSASWRTGRCASIRSCRDVPLISDLAKTPEQKQALELALARLEFGRPFFLPPNVPADARQRDPPRVRRHDEGSRSSSPRPTSSRSRSIR